jgi:hypothetical protein
MQNWLLLLCLTLKQSPQICHSGLKQIQNCDWKMIVTREPLMISMKRGVAAETAELPMTSTLAPCCQMT